MFRLEKGDKRYANAQESKPTRVQPGQRQSKAIRSAQSGKGEIHLQIRRAKERSGLRTGRKEMDGT